MLNYLFSINNIDIIADVQSVIKKFFYIDVIMKPFDNDKNENALLTLTNYYMFTTDCSIDFYYHLGKVVGMSITGQDTIPGFCDYILITSRLNSIWNQENKPNMHKKALAILPSV